MSQDAPPSNSTYSKAKQCIDAILNALRCTVVGTRITKQTCLTRKSGKGKTSVHSPSETFRISLFEGGLVSGIPDDLAVKCAKSINDGIVFILSPYRASAVDDLASESSKEMTLSRVKRMASVLAQISALDALAVRTNYNGGKSSSLYSPGVGIVLKGDDRTMNKIVRDMNAVIMNVLSPIIGSMQSELSETIKGL
jgi:hypothetical protein